MSITLDVNGNVMTFSQKELETILSDVFTRGDLPQMKVQEDWYEVNPKSINPGFFNDEKEDTKQEATRRIILGALAKVESEPEKYAKPFKLIIPNKMWSEESLEWFEKIAENFGGHVADWVEQGLEWAQRIMNGEKWEDLCNSPDTSKWYRVIIWRNDWAHLIGGSKMGHCILPMTAVSECSYNKDIKLKNAVPLIVVDR